MSNAPKQKPAHKTRLGVLSVTPWRNVSEKGPRRSVAPSRRYKQGGDRKDADNLGFDDLRSAAKLLDRAQSCIAQQQAEPRATSDAETVAA
jgi:hypothetical protein